MAAPGRMACAMASPVRLMRRSMRKTPTGQELTDKEHSAKKGALHETELGEWRDEEGVKGLHQCCPSAWSWP